MLQFWWCTKLQNLNLKSCSCNQLYLDRRMVKCVHISQFLTNLWLTKLNKVQLVFGQIESGLLKNNPVLYSGNYNKKLQKTCVFYQSILHFIKAFKVKKEEPEMKSNLIWNQSLTTFEVLTFLTIWWTIRSVMLGAQFHSPRHWLPKGTGFMMAFLLHNKWLASLFSSTPRFIEPIHIFWGQMILFRARSMNASILVLELLQFWASTMNWLILPISLDKEFIWQIILLKDKITVYDIIIDRRWSSILT